MPFFTDIPEDQLAMLERLALASIDNGLGDVEMPVRADWVAELIAMSRRSDKQTEKPRHRVPCGSRRINSQEA
jgi:hypothetical protein